MKIHSPGASVKFIYEASAPRLAGAQLLQKKGLALQRLEGQAPYFLEFSYYFFCGTIRTMSEPQMTVPFKVLPERVASVAPAASCNLSVSKKSSKSIRPSLFTSSNFDLTGETPANFTVVGFIVLSSKSAVERI